MLVICPSRGRPGNIDALLECWKLTEADAELVVCVDDDDPTAGDYPADVTIGPRTTLGGWTNRVAVARCHDHDIIGVIGDDVRPRSLHWDAELAAAMVPFGVVYGNDLHQSERMPTHPFLDAEIVRRLGYMAAPGIDHLYLDDAWKAIGEHLGTLTYCPNVILEHVHPHAGKAPMDEGYRQVNARHAYKEGKRQLARYLSGQFESDMALLA
jgi:hypothetical protein